MSESASGASAIVCAPCTRVSAPSYSGRDVISTIDGVRGMTVRKSASIDSLTGSIQCASSMMNSVGSVRASVVGVDQCGQPAPPRIRVDGGQWHVGVGDAEQIIEQQQILRVDIGTYICPQLRAGGVAVEVSHTAARPQQPRHGIERDVTGVGFAEGPKHVDPATGRQRRGFPRRPGFADARRSHHIHHTTAATDRALHQGVERPPSPSADRPGSPRRAPPGLPWADRH